MVAGNMEKGFGEGHGWSKEKGGQYGPIKGIVQAVMKEKGEYGRGHDQQIKLGPRDKAGLLLRGRPPPPSGKWESR